VLKGRQQGASTYIGGRYYWRTTHRHGVRTFILTHEQTATDTLFEMVDRYHEHCPAIVRPQTGAANAKELSFSALDSGYQVGTAGPRRSGGQRRSSCSTAPRWRSGPMRRATLPGWFRRSLTSPTQRSFWRPRPTASAASSTSAGSRPKAGIGDYIAIFIPWFWEDGYARDATGFARTTKRKRNTPALHGLTNEQLAWRRNKIAELKDPLLFMQEYPATAAEAFQMSGHDSFIKPGDVLKARKATSKASAPRFWASIRLGSAMTGSA
jgi:hypothetical protein